MSTEENVQVSLRYELGGLWERSLYRFVSLLRKSLVAADPCSDRIRANRK